MVVIKKNTSRPSDSSSAVSDEGESDIGTGSGMAVVGQLDNPSAEGSFEISEAPPLIDPDRQVEGTPVGNVP